MRCGCFDVLPLPLEADPSFAEKLEQREEVKGAKRQCGAEYKKGRDQSRIHKRNVSSALNLNEMEQ